MSNSSAGNSPAADQPRGGWWGLLAAVGQGAAGPGIVVTGSVIGQGRRSTDRCQRRRGGLIRLWAVLFSFVIEYFRQLEIGRHGRVERRPRDTADLEPNGVQLVVAWSDSGTASK